MLNILYIFLVILPRATHNRNGDEMKYTFQIIYFILIYLCTTQIQPYLKTQGFDMIQCAYFYSGSAFIAYLFQWSYQKLCNNHSIVISLKLGICLLICLVYFMTTQSMIFICAVLLFACSKTLINLNETYCFQEQRNYGRLRCFASIGMGIGAILSIQWIKSLSVIYLILPLLILICIPLSQNKESQKMNIIKLNQSDFYLLCMLSLLFAIGSADQYIVTQKIMELKGNSVMIGIKMAIQCFSEIPFYYFMNHIFQRFSFQSIMRLAIICFGIRFGLYAILQDASMIVIVSFLQGLTLPLMMSASKFYIQKLHPDSKNGAQFKLLSLFTTIALVLAPLVYGYLSQVLYIDGVLYLCTILCLIVYFLQIKLDKC